MVCKTYEETQDLIKGQEQHVNELKHIFQTPPNNLTKTQFSHARKFTKYLMMNNLDEIQGAKLLNVTPGECLNVTLNITPITPEMEYSFLLATQQHLSQLRLDPISQDLRNSCIQKFKEIMQTFQEDVPPLKIKKSLFSNCWSKEALIENSISGYSHPYLGAGLKALRLALGLNQYSLPELFKEVGGTGKYITRDWYKFVEQKNKIDRMGNILFYRKFGKTVEQLIYPFLAWVAYYSINPEVFNEANSQEEILELIKSY